jgi:AAA15 family ATPase/GTPase
MSKLPFRQITADGFRGLRKLQVDELRSVNIFVGGNNSGKTSILEAIALLTNPYNSSEWTQVVRRRDFGRLDESPILSLRWCFSQELSSTIDPNFYINNKLNCTLGADGHFPIRTIKSSYKEFNEEIVDKEIFEEEVNGEVISNEITTQKIVRSCIIESNLDWAESNYFDQEFKDETLPKKSSRLKHSDNRPMFYALDIGYRKLSRQGKFGLNYAALLPYSYQLNTLQVTRHSEFIFKDKDNLLEIIRCFDNQVEGIEIASFLGERPAIYIKHEQLGVAPLSAFGDAMRRCLLLATTMASLGPGGVLLLDEIEVGIHTDALPKIFNWLVKTAKKLEIQVFATTHSIEVLDALLASELNEDDLAAYQVKQIEEKTECKRFSGSTLKRIRQQRGLDIR